MGITTKRSRQLHPLSNRITPHQKTIYQQILGKSTLPFPKSKMKLLILIGVPLFIAIVSTNAGVTEYVGRDNFWCQDSVFTDWDSVKEAKQKCAEIEDCFMFYDKYGEGYLFKYCKRDGVQKVSLI